MRAFGKYQLIERVAEGGMAEVWRAEAPGAQGFVKDVALKLIRGDHDARGDFVQMFIQEARLASRLSHANIVQVFDFDQVDGRYYIAMELVRGRTLRDVVQRARELGVRLGVTRAVHVCAEVARALAYAHRHDEAGGTGVVHRDVSPQNILLSFQGDVKLTDFGIARALGVNEVTAPGTVKGKLAYMAPEQARGETVDGRADVFSLGIVLWELCAGRRLFARETEAATLGALLASERVSPPSAWNEAVPPELDAAVLGALERSPERRTSSAEELARELGSIRLRLASGHDDLDLRALMRQLFPEGWSAPMRPSDAPTQVRDASAAEAGSGSGATAAAEGDAGRGRDAPTLTAPESGDERRGPRGPRGIPTGSRTILLALVAASLLGGVALWWGMRRPAAEPRGAAAAPAVRELAPPPAVAAPGPSAPLAAPPAATPDSSAGPAAPDPAATSAPAIVGPGTVSVYAVPWAYVDIDGVARGETPVEVRLEAGRHRLHARHPSLGEDELEVEIAPGQHVAWRPKLKR